MTRASSLAVLALLLAAGIYLAAQRPEPTAALGTCGSAEVADVADSIAAAFDTHQFVFIGSTHGDQKRSEFLLCLLSRPKFQQRVTDVLVEWANPAHQTLLDRYLVSLEPVPDDSLRQVWFDTDGPELWAGLRQIPEFFAAARAINTRLERPRRIRVLGGCEPVNWTLVRSATDIAGYPFKTNWAAHVITEHFAVKPDARLLVVYGDGHIHHNGGTLMADIEAKLDRQTLFVVGTIPDGKNSERIARLGNPGRPFFVPAQKFPTSGPYPEALFYVVKERLSSYVDAVAYLGPEPDHNLAGSIELTAAQRAELARRNRLMGDRRELMQLRFARRNIWFQSHPDDIAVRP